MFVLTTQPLQVLLFGAPVVGLEFDTEIEARKAADSCSGQFWLVSVAKNAPIVAIRHYDNPDVDGSIA